MARETLRVALGERRYRVERPWGDVPEGLVSDVACCSRGHVFVLLRHDSYLDPDRPAVIELSPEGRRLAAWGGEAVADGHMFACGPDDRLYVVDRDAHEVVVFDRSGQHLGGLGTRHGPGAPFNHPSGVAIAPWGDVYVADGYAASRVHRFSADGRSLGAWGAPGEAPGDFATPHAVWATADGRVLVADRENDRLQAFTREGEWLGTWRGFAKPMDMLTDAEGCILVSDQVPRLTMLSPNGTLLARCRPVLNGAHGLSMDGAGRLYLAEMSPPRVTRLVPEPA